MWLICLVRRRVHCQETVNRDLENLKDLEAVETHKSLIDTASQNVSSIIISAADIRHSNSKFDWCRSNIGQVGLLDLSK